MEKNNLTIFKFHDVMWSSFCDGEFHQVPGFMFRKNENNND